MYKGMCDGLADGSIHFHEFDRFVLCVLPTWIRLKILELFPPAKESLSVTSRATSCCIGAMSGAWDTCGADIKQACQAAELSLEVTSMSNIESHDGNSLAKSLYKENIPLVQS